MSEGNPGGFRRVPEPAFGFGPWQLGPDFQTGGVRVGFKGEHPPGVGAQQLLHAGHRGIPATQPDDFRRVPAQNAQVGEIGIKRDDDEPVGFGVVPEDEVVGPFKSQEARLS